jgi:hypothetical protein
MYLSDFLDGFDRLVAFDAETTGKRTPDDMADTLSGAKRAKPELLIVRLTVPQLRAALQLFEESTDGRKEELVQRLLLVGGRAPPVSSSSTTASPPAPVRASGTTDFAAEYRHPDQAVQRHAPAGIDPLRSLWQRDVSGRCAPGAAVLTGHRPSLVHPRNASFSRRLS